MLVKWITCTVPPGHAVAFSRAQQRWAALRAVDGMVCQVGGWDRAACILAVWRDSLTYQSFMLEQHDEMFDATRQAGTFQASEVTVGTTDGMLGGLFSYLGGSRYLVTTAWRDEESHHRYVVESVPALRAEAGTKRDTDRVTTYSVRLDPLWTV